MCLSHKCNGTTYTWPNIHVHHPLEHYFKGESNPNKKLFLEEKEKSDKLIHVGKILNNVGHTIRKL